MAIDDAEGPAAPPTRPASPRRGAVDLLLLAALLLPALVFAAIALRDRSQTLAGARRDVVATLDTLHAHAAGTFQFQALALGAATEWLRDLDDAALTARLPLHHAQLATLRRDAGQRLGVVVFGADGRPVIDSERPQPPADIDVSDRAYFRWHRAHDELTLRVAAPVRSRADGSAVIFVTRRRSDAEGRFLGVIAAGVRESTLIDIWNRAAPDRNAMVILVRADGTVLARRPPLDAAEGARLQPDSPVMQAIQAGHEGTPVRAVSSLDGVERIFAVRGLANFPVYIAHGVPLAAALAPWRQRLFVYGGFALAGALSLTSLALVVRRRTRQLDELNAGLERRVAERTAEILAGEAQLRLLAREVDHRAKNALAVVQATLRLTPKGDTETYARAVEGRVAALARVQTLLAQDRWRGANLRSLLEVELAPFVGPSDGRPGPRAELDGPPVLLSPPAAQPIAMAAHELATNAVKHGALSVPAGRVRITWRHDGDGGDGANHRGTGEPMLQLRWMESGGPRIAAPPERRGFGSRVLDSVVRGQLGGSLSMDWAPAGLVCEIRVPLARVAPVG